MALQGIKVIEMGGLAPAPHCGKVLRDFGATVIRVDKPGHQGIKPLTEGKHCIEIDLKGAEGQALLGRMMESADVFIDCYRPGVMERLGLGPQDIKNPGLIYARITGYGQSGPLSDQGGHDINYLAMSGVLSMIGRKGEKPLAPVNFIADFAAGGLGAAFGIVLALLDRKRSGQGQAVDVSMTEGSAYLSSFIHEYRHHQLWQDGRGNNLIDTGAPFYDTYEAKHGGYVAVGAIEPKFFGALLAGLGLSEEFPDQMDQTQWPGMAKRFTEVFLTKTRDEWVEVFRDRDACVTPVLNPMEVGRHPHHFSRKSFRTLDESHFMPEASPRLSGLGDVPAQGGIIETLGEFGLQPKAIEDAKKSGYLIAP